MNQPYPADETASLPFQEGEQPEPWVQVHGDLYTQIPEGLLYDPTIDAIAIRVYGALRRHGEDPTNCFPSHKRLGELLGLAERSVQRPLVTLEKAGWISRVYRSVAGRETSCGYIVYLSPLRVEERGARVAQRVLARAPERGPARAGERVERKPIERKPINEPASEARHAARRVPDDFAVSDEMLAWAAEKTPGILVAAETDKFIDYWKGKGTVQKDWVATWRNWMRNALKFKSERDNAKPKSSIRMPVIEDRDSPDGPYDPSTY